MGAPSSLPFWCEAPPAAQDQNQTMSFNGVAAGGQFQLQFQLNSQAPVLTTAPIAWNASAAAIAAALNALYAPADITGSGSIASQSVVLDMGAESETNLILMLQPVNVTLVTAGAAPIEITPSISQEGLLPPTIPVDTAHQNNGFHFLEFPPFNMLNTLLNNLAQWIRYFNVVIFGIQKGENLFRNAGCEVASRGNGGSVTAGTSAYTLDGWILGCTGANAGWNQQSALNAPSPLGHGINAVSGMTDVFLEQKIESLISWGGITPGDFMTFQAVVDNNNGSPTLPTQNPTLTVKLLGGATLVNAVALAPCPFGAVTRVAYTFQIPIGTNTLNGLDVILDFGGGLNQAGGGAIIVSSFDLSRTPNMTTVGIPSFVPVPQIRSIAEEKPACERYLRVYGGNSLNEILATGFGNNSNPADLYLPLSPPMAATPSLTISSAGHFKLWDTSLGSGQTVTALALSSQAGPRMAVVQPSVASNPSGGVGLFLQANATLSARLTLSAEL